MGEVGPEQLLAGLANGQEAAFAALYRLFGARLFRTAKTLLNSSADAEDAVQEVFVALVRSRHQLRQVENFTAYLFTSLRHAVARIGQRKQQERRQSQKWIEWRLAAAEPTSGCSESDNRANWLRAAIQQLSAEQREVLALKVDGELTFGEIATALAISPNTAASRYRYALEKLRDTANQESIE